MFQMAIFIISGAWILANFIGLIWPNGIYLERKAK
jgi:hypothetical protein